QLTDDDGYRADAHHQRHVLQEGVGYKNKHRASRRHALPAPSLPAAATLPTPGSGGQGKAAKLSLRAPWRGRLATEAV
ncbi:MAG TPA: hypothetical protein VE309_11125, partial [Caulobacteraceae bacterium]|nr:hypothetical protein [Caulobacteraceae bacterium]